MQEIEEYRAFNMIEPFGDEWRQTALLARMLCFNKDAKIDDFMPIPKGEDKEQSADEILAILSSASQINKNVTLNKGGEEIP